MCMAHTLTLSKRIFVLGPSHYQFIQGCTLSECNVYETPLGPLRLDQEVAKSLSASNLFQFIGLKAEEEEHSIEMQLPYIKFMIRDADIPIVPIIVGHNPSSQFAELLKPYLQDSLFVISSDFCHWGQRFRYTPTAKDDTPIHQFIEDMDRKGIELIERNDLYGFLEYLEGTENTICGRNPITLLLMMFQGMQARIKNVHYAQSSACTCMRDSSVSYATFYAALM